MCRRFWRIVVRCWSGVCIVGFRCAGLGEEGRCPECGEEFPAEGVVLIGNDVEWRRIGMGVGLFLMVWHFGAMLIAVPLGFLLFLVLLVAAFVAMVWSIVREVWEHRKGSPVVQAQLTPDGFGQRRGFGPIVLHRWGEVEIDLTEVRPGKYRLKIVGITTIG